MLVQLSFGDEGASLFDHAGGSLVSVIIGIFEEFSAAVDQAEIDAPAIDGESGDGFFGPSEGEGETFFNLVKEGHDVPA